MPDEYQIGSGLSEQELQAASWWVKHRLGLRRLGYVLAVSAILLGWGYFLWTALDMYGLSAARERAIIPHLAHLQLDPGAMDAIKPQALQPSDTLTLPTSGGRESFLIQISNPNAHWWADLTYHFDVDNEHTPTAHAFILPQSQRYVSGIGWKSKNPGTNGQFHIENIVWHRINPVEVEGDYPAFASKRLQLNVTDAAYTDNAVQIDGHGIGQSQFVLRNPSAYGFWSVDLTVILYQSGVPAAVAVLNQQNILPGENRALTMNWFDSTLTNVSKTEVSADVNILDPKAFLPAKRF